MNWNDVAGWKKNYIALSLAIWALTISISMFFYMGTGTGGDLPPAPFVWGFIVLLIAMLLYVPINIIYSLKEFKVKGGKYDSTYVLTKIFWLILDLLAIYYFLYLFFTYKDVYLGFL
jgi:hypothetical protein